MTTPLPPRDVAPLFLPLLAELIALLRGLGPRDWERQTVAPRWKVRDVAAHLLDVELRKTAAYRDDHDVASGATIASDSDLSRLVNGLNAGGVAFAARLSPRLIVDLLEVAGAWAADVIEALPPYETARYAVSWAGESESQNWMDVGRDYTERWHHQAQIRDAVAVPRLLEPRWMEPLLEFSVRALPMAYSGISAPPSTAVTLTVHGETSDEWSLVRGDSSLQILHGTPSTSAATVRVSTDDSWRLFYNALSPGAVADRVTVSGDRTLAEPLLRARSVIL
jgi:uncharacterized protein (TIGR03083 family)